MAGAENVSTDHERDTAGIAGDRVRDVGKSDDGGLRVGGVSGNGRQVTRSRSAKRCKGCGATFLRNNKFSKLQWERTRFCGLACSARQVHSYADDIARIMDNCSPEPNSGCWLWTGTCRGHMGYGAVKSGGKHVAAHRLSYSTFVDRIDDGHEVCHQCDVPSCVNPEHLFLGTALDNKRDCVRKDRHNRGERHGKAKLTPPDVIAIRSLIEAGAPRKSIADRYGVAVETVSSIGALRTWRHLR